MPSEYRQGFVPPEKVTHVIVCYPLPYALYVQQRYFVVVIDGKPAYVTLDLVASDEVRGLPPSIRVPQPSRLRFDRWGRHGYTMVSISIPRHSWPPDYIPDLNHDDSFVILSILYCNKLIRIYRMVCKEYLCDEICERDIHYYRFILVNSNEKVCDVADKFFPFEVSLHAGPDVTFHGEDKANAIADMAMSGQDTDDFDELIVQSNSYFLKGNYSLAAFFAALSFEFYCKRVIRRGYLRSGKGTDATLEQLLENTNLKTLIKKHLPIATGYDFSRTKEFAEWDSIVRPVRNAIAHGSILYLSKKDAMQIMKIVHNCIENLRLNIHP